MWNFGTEAEQFPEKKYLNGILVAVYDCLLPWPRHLGSRVGELPDCYLYIYLGYNYVIPIIRA
jgi:hypothetical protein